MQIERMNELHKKLVQKLGVMQDRLWMVDSKQHRIIKWGIDDERGAVTVISDNNGWWTWEFEEALEKLKTFLPIESSNKLPMVRKPPAVSKPGNDTAPAGPLDTVNHLQGKMIGVIDTLLDTIDKVAEDPKYIPQAQAMCKTVNAVVQIVRADLDVARFMEKAKKK